MNANNQIAIIDNINVAKCQFFQLIYNSDKGCFEYYCSAKLGLCTGNCSFVREQKYIQIFKDIKSKIDGVLDNADK